ncbi:MAG: hypothetical protein ACE5GE_02925 [Phycisphaerae bacterium]
MKRLTLLAAMVCLVWSTAAPAQTRGNSSGKPGFGRGSAGLAQARSKRHRITESQRVLAKPVSQIDWDETPLEDIVDWLGKQGEASVVVMWKSLEDEGIDQDTAVTLKIKKTTVGRALAEALNQISDVEPIMYRGMDDIIKITTKADFNKKLYVRVYPIQDMLLNIPDFTDAPEVDLSSQSGGGGGGGGGGGQGEPIFSDDDDEDSDDSEVKTQRIDDLIVLIEDTIEPNTWQTNGGRGTVTVYNDMLVVRNSIEVHEKIGGPFQFE